MLNCEILLIGGGIAAYSAAKKLRREDPSARLIMVSADHLPPYNLPPISKEFLRGEMTESDIVYPTLQTMGGPIDLLLSTNVTELDAAGHVASLSDGQRVKFAKALVATGASPIPLAVDGADLPGVFYVRTAADARAIATAATRSRHAVVIGAGFIGLEVAASLRRLGLQVTVIEAQNRVWPRFADAGIAEVVHTHCAKHGVRLLFDQRVVRINGDSGVTSVTTSAGSVIDCDLVCVGIGVTPNTALAHAAGLEISNGVVVDAQMRTSAPDIYAAGDVVNFLDQICGRRMRAEHWGHAEYSGQLAGQNMAGRATHYDFMSYAWSDVFDLHIETAGYPDDHDEIVIRGALDAPSFISLYLRQGMLIGYCAVNAEPVEFALYRRLIRSRRPLAGHLASLRDAAVNIRELLRV